ncbi:hypothetical protein [Spiroplasma endosymbiont of Diplazon laetatorius]|uniref:hypothetical protein n=1 Tax=Spiroplasma endosymbiont of Diplazon laetatorius TaxID=3066322 RepID=UPI0030CD473D
MKNDNKIILSHLRMYWKPLTYFLTILTLYTISLLSVGMFSNIEGNSFSLHFGGPYIGKIEMWYSSSSELPFQYREHIENYYSKWISEILFIGPTTVFLSIATAYFINKFFTSEIKEGKIVTWLTLPISKQKIFLMKAVSIIIINIILTSSVSMVTLIFCSTAQDANKYFLRLFWYCLQFIIFNIFLTTIFIMIGLTLVKKPSFISILIFTAIIIYIFTMWLLYYFYKSGGGNTPNNPFKGFAAVEFLTLDKLIMNPLNFGNEFSENKWKDEYKYFWTIYEYFIKDNIYLNIFIPIIYLGSSTAVIYLTSIYIKKIDLFV